MRKGDAFKDCKKMVYSYGEEEIRKKGGDGMVFMTFYGGRDSLWVRVLHVVWWGGALE